MMFKLIEFIKQKFNKKITVTVPEDLVMFPKHGLKMSMPPLKKKEKKNND